MCIRDSLATHTLLKLFKLQCNYAYVSLEITQSAIVRVSALKLIATFTTEIVQNPIDELRQHAKADIIIQLSWTVNQTGDVYKRQRLNKQ